MDKGGKNHKDLIAWQVANDLDDVVIEIINKIANLDIRLKSQILAANDSISANLIEGYYSGSDKEFIRFARYARRSCGELYDRVFRLMKRDSVEGALFVKFDDHAKRTGYLIDRLIQGLIVKTKKK